MSDTLKQDLRYAVRSLFAKPGFFIASVLTLALGIGANGAAFALLHGVLLAPLPYPDSERLVSVYNAHPNLGFDGSASIPDYLERRAGVAAFADMALYHEHSVNLTDGGETERLQGLRATPSLFATLAVAPAVGRAFTDEEAAPGHAGTIVLGHALWRSRFGADPGLVGRDIRLDGEAVRVVGVMPPDFAFPDARTQFWLPFGFTPEQRSEDQRGHEFASAIARLAPGATIEQAEQQMAALVQASAIGRRYVEQTGYTGKARSLHAAWTGERRAVVLLLQAVALFVLLIGCANVANLQLIRAASRQKEFAVRSALGAGRARVVRLLLTESIALALAGGVAGLLLAALALRLVDGLGLLPGSGAFHVGLDAPVLAFIAAATLATGVLVGTLPALLPTRAVSAALRDGGRGTVGGRRTQAAHGGLVALQLMLATALLVGSGLLLRSFQQLLEQPTGFESAGVLTAQLELPASRYRDDAERSAFYTRLLAELRALPGVSAVGMVNHLPLSGGDQTSNYAIEGLVDPADTAGATGRLRSVDEGYFEAMGIPLRSGRVFDAGDEAGREPVAIIDETLARREFGQADPIGRRVARGGGRAPDTQWWRIVGVVGTVKHDSLGEHVDKGTLYRNYRQSPAPQTTLTLRTSVAPAALAAPLREALHRVDPLQAFDDVRSLAQRLDASMAPRRTPMALSLAFAGIAVLLAMIGTYGVLAYSVGQRTGELGLRLAVGASRGRIVRLVLAQGVRLVGIGLALGLAAAFALSRLLGAQLYGVSAADPITYVVAALLLGAVALVACWLPARRASRVDPIVALRYE